MDHLSLVTHRELEIAVRVFHPEAPKTVVAWHGWRAMVATSQPWQES